MLISPNKREVINKMEVITTLITNVGFPIVISLILLNQLKTVQDSHKEETDKFTEALNENTLVLQKLCDKLGVEREVKE